MVKPIDLSVSQEIRADGTRRTISLRNAGSSGADSLEIHVDLLGETDVPAPDVLDGFVIGVIFHAMASGRPLRIHGALSRSACMNLHEYQAAWMVWQPGRYRQVELIPDSVVDLPIATQPPRAISAFSGGVDGSFTAVRHARGWLGNASYPLHDVALVQGFDVPLDDDAGFERLVLRIRPLIDALGVRLRLMRTNLKHVARQRWEDSFGAQIASCLHNFSHLNAYGLMGSGEPYSHITYPWGSTPATDYLLSGDRMRLILDGSAYSRTEKIEGLSREPNALNVLKVCWEGSDPGRNCGHCEKCVRTRLNLLAVGVTESDCFDEPFDLAEIGRIKLDLYPQYVELATILEYAAAHGVSGEWVTLLKRRLAAYKRRAALNEALASTRGALASARDRLRAGART